MVKAPAPLHPADLMSDGYNTNEFDKPENNNAPFRAGVACPVDAFNPAWCHESGDLRAKGPDGLDYPVRAFGPAGPFAEADLVICGVFTDTYSDGALDGREFGTCHQLPSCAPCSSYVPCAGVTVKLAEPTAGLTAKTLLKLAVDPALDGTTLEGNLGQCLEPSTDPADPLNVGVVERGAAVFVLNDEGEYEMEDSKVSSVCATVGGALKDNGRPWVDPAAAEEAPKEG